MDYNQIIQMLFGGGMGASAMPPGHRFGPPSANVEDLRNSKGDFEGKGNLEQPMGGMGGMGGAIGQGGAMGLMGGMMGAAPMGLAPQMAMSAVPPDLIKNLVKRIFG